MVIISIKFQVPQLIWIGLTAVDLLLRSCDPSDLGIRSSSGTRTKGERRTYGANTHNADGPTFRIICSGWQRALVKEKVGWVLRSPNQDPSEAVVLLEMADHFLQILFGRLSILLIDGDYHVDVSSLDHNASVFVHGIRAIQGGTQFTVGIIEGFSRNNDACRSQSPRLVGGLREMDCLLLGDRKLLGAASQLLTGQLIIYSRMCEEFGAKKRPIHNILPNISACLVHLRRKRRKIEVSCIPQVTVEGYWILIEIICVTLGPEPLFTTLSSQPDCTEQKLNGKWQGFEEVLRYSKISFGNKNWFFTTEYHNIKQNIKYMIIWIWI